MAALQKNIASQNFAFSLVNSSSGAASTTTSTGSLTAFVTKDGTQASAGGTFTYLGTGEWNYAPTQAETNCTNFALYVTASSNIPFHGTIWTDLTDAGGNIQVDTTKFGGTTVTARDIGANVLLSSGTGTGQLVLSSGVAQANVTQISSSATAANALNNSTLSICWGTASSGTTTTVVASSINNPTSLSDTGQLIGRTIIFLGTTTTTNLQAQASNITNSTVGATPTITYTAMTHAPANGDTFVVI